MHTKTSGSTTPADETKQNTAAQIKSKGTNTGTWQGTPRGQGAERRTREERKQRQGETELNAKAQRTSSN